MTDADGDNGGRNRMGWGRVIGMTSLRTLCVALASGVTIMVLMGMILEQDKVQSCVNMRDTGPTMEELQQRQERQLAAIVDALTQLKPLPNNQTQTNPQGGDDVKDKWDYNWDKKQWATKEEAMGVGTRTVLLVRHGQYDYSTGKLTELGRRQANATGLRLKELGMRYSAITHSPMIRAQETAEWIHGHLPDLTLYVDPILEEGGPAPPEPTITYWSLPKRDYFVNGPRMESAFRKYIYRADKAQTQQSFDIIVGHGNLFRYFSLRAMQFPSNAWMRVFIAHASITQLNINPDGTITMTRFGDSGHFRPDQVTY